MADVEAEHSDRTGPEGGFGRKGEATYRQKLPAIRAWLIDVARRGEKVTYGEVMERFAVDRFSLRHAMDSLGHQAHENGEPVLTAVIVSKQTRRCSEGLAKEFGIQDDQQERERLRTFWLDRGGDLNLPTTSDARSRRPPYPFVIGRAYSRSDVFDLIGLRPHPTGGPWFTGHTEHGSDWFIFCGIGTAGRTGHDYGNHFEGDRLAWSGKTNSALRQPSVQRLLNTEGRIYLFYREQDRDPFTFAGLARPVEVFDETPVRVLWEFSSTDANTLPTTLPEEIGAVETVLEGAVRTVTVNVFERDPNARRKCIAQWGTRCVVCSFDFGEHYGELGAGFIHVHHLRPLAEIGERYELNPIADLRPVCPNCHAMLHRRQPTLTIEQLLAFMQRKFPSR